MHLPAGAQTWISCGYDNAWTLNEHLTASVFDAVQVSNWQRAGDSSTPRPKAIPRPSQVVEQGQKSDRMAERARAHMARQQALNQATPQRKRDAHGRFVKVESGT